MSILGAIKIDIDQNASHESRLETAREAYMKNPQQMTSILARQCGLTELDVIGILPSELATPLDVTRWEDIIRGFEALGDVHVIMTNSSGVLEVFGKFGNFSQTGPYFNVQTKSIDMHIRPDTFEQIFAVEKPSHMDGISTLSVQFYNKEGSAAFKVFLTFGSKAPTPERRAQWDAIRKQYAIV